MAQQCRVLQVSSLQIFFFPSCTVSPCELPGVPWAPERSGTVKPNTGPRIIRTEGGGGLQNIRIGAAAQPPRLTPEKIFIAGGG